MSITIDRFDHVVITVRDLEASLAFYSRVLGMRVERRPNGRVSLHFGNQKFNVHPEVNDIGLKAHHPTLGSADFCLIASTPIDQVVQHLDACGVAIVSGPGKRDGATGTILSVYFRDPDQNLVEVSNYL
jgi:catechol 2,3-dioxygenase-like lactoylglutathione lyase family enzyme